MNNALTILRKFMLDENIDCLLVNSTNEFLMEYNSLQNNSRYKVTGFSGSTGDALITFDNVYLFVDGRYHIQADLEVDTQITTVVKLQTGQTFIDEMLNKVPPSKILGIFSKKISQSTLEKIQSRVKVKLLSIDPLDTVELVQKNAMVELSEQLTGLSTEKKIEKLNLNADEALVLTNLEDVSYLFNMRDFSTPFSSKIKGKAVVLQNNAFLFTTQREFEEYIKALNKKIFIDRSTINAYDYALTQVTEIENNPIKLMKSIKTDAEILHYTEAFSSTDKVMMAIRNYILDNDGVSEADIAQKLEQEFYKHGAKSLSFNSIVAKDRNSALAHYSKTSKDEIITDGSLVLIDCGAYFDGGLATDITRVFVKGKPSTLQKQVYTTVLKALITAFNTNKKTGYEIDNDVREFFNLNVIDGFVFNHGLGHGIGINVHEAPPSLSKTDIAKVILKENMCFTIEPGLYNEKHFGVRLENSCYIKDGKINSFVKMPFEKKLINFDMLTENEKSWIDEFGVI